MVAIPYIPKDFEFVIVPRPLPLNMPSLNYNRMFILFQTRILFLFVIRIHNFLIYENIKFKCSIPGIPRILNKYNKIYFIKFV